MYQKLALKVGSKLAVTGLTLGKAVLANVAHGLALTAAEIAVSKITSYRKKNRSK